MRLYLWICGSAPEIIRVNSRVREFPGPRFKSIYRWGRPFEAGVGKRKSGKPSPFHYLSIDFNELLNACSWRRASDDRGSQESDSRSPQEIRVRPAGRVDQTSSCLHWPGWSDEREGVARAVCHVPPNVAGGQPKRQL